MQGMWHPYLDKKNSSKDAGDFHLKSWVNPHSKATYGLELFDTIYNIYLETFLF